MHVVHIFTDKDYHPKTKYYLFLSKVKGKIIRSLIIVPTNILNRPNITVDRMMQ